MQIISDIKAFIKTPDDFIKSTPEKALKYSIALKIIAIVTHIFKSSYPLYFICNPYIYFLASLYVDYKFYKNATYLFFMFLEKAVNSKTEYPEGFFFGRIAAIFFKSDLPRRMQGFQERFKDGFKDEWNKEKK
ncbi:MAG: hypothetical protein KR126chlam6_00082 [Candidatus Anoxychlamydiales bacterium]|nr:hypothetical protein [Candidatus Anoxychlamydiales bacterium]